MSKQLESILKRATSATPRPVMVPGPEATVTPIAIAAAPAAPASTLAVEPEPATAAETSTKAPEASSATASSAPAPQEEPAAKPKEAQKAIQAFVPASVARALNIRAAEEGVTVRTIILQGLKSIGVDVPEAELRDRRKT